MGYAYNNDGSLQERTWAGSGSAASRTTTYTYHPGGQLKKIDYPDATPDVDLTYDRAGRVKTLSDAAGLHTFVYAANGDVQETVTGGLLDGLVLNKKLNAAGHVSAMEWTYLGVSQKMAYTYDSQSRLENASLGPVSGTPLVTASYGYHPGTGRVKSLTRPIAGGAALVGTQTLDAAGRLDSSVWKRGNTVYGSYDYGLDAAGRRTTELRADGTQLEYDYNDRGELTGAVRRRVADSSLRPDWTHSYVYDTEGNRTSTVTPEGETLVSSLTASPETGGTYYGTGMAFKSWLRGRANPLAEVKVDGQVAAREGETWRHLLTLTSPWESQNATITATRNDLTPVPAPVTQAIKVRANTRLQEPFAGRHDERGNLLADANWIYTWDAENRLVMQEMRFQGAPGESGATVKRLEFQYDGRGRRIWKKETFAWRNRDGSLGSPWSYMKETVFLWQDWTLVAEFVRRISTGSPLKLKRSYLWGLDINGTLGGVGGVGGLLWVADYHVSNPFEVTPAVSNRQLAPWYDGNGNVMGWVENEGAQMLPLHRLEYDPYGQVLVDDAVRVSWTKKQRDLDVAAADLERPPFGFSTKYEDVESGLLYYGYRYYSPEMGRWISRDPIGEHGGINLYGVVGNDTVNEVDLLGLRMCMWQLNVVGSNPARDRTTGSLGAPVSGQHVAAMAAVTEFFPMWSAQDGSEINAPKYLLDGDPSQNEAWVLLVAKTSRGRIWHGPDFPPANGLRFGEGRNPWSGRNTSQNWPAYLRNNVKIKMKESGEIVVEKNPDEVWNVPSEGAKTGLGTALAAQFTHTQKQIEGGWELELTYSVSGGWSSEGVVSHNGSGFFPPSESGPPGLEQFVVGGGRVNDDMRHNPRSRPRDPQTGQGAPIRVKLKIRSYCGPKKPAN